MEKTVNDNNFLETIGSAKVALVDFWAPWCGPCRMLGPAIAEIAKEYDGRVVVGKYNIDDFSDVASKLGIMSIPTVILFKDGQIADMMIGLRDKEEITAKIDALL